MSFAKQYQDHAFYDLIEEAEKQGIAIGVEAERERIINLLDNWGEEAGCYCCASDVAAGDIIELIKGEQK